MCIAVCSETLWWNDIGLSHPISNEWTAFIKWGVRGNWWERCCLSCACLWIVCMHQQLVYPQAVHLNISCQNLSACGFTQANFHFLSIVLLFLSVKKTAYLPLVWPCFYIVWNITTCYPVNPAFVPQNENIVQSQTQVTYLSIQQPGCSSAGGFIHSLHHGAVNSFSYPVKGRVNPPSIWHAAHLAERDGGWLEGGELWGSCGGDDGGGGGTLWEVSSWADGPLSGVVSGVFTWQRRLQDLTGPGHSIQVATAPPDQLEERWDHLTLAGKWYTLLCCFVLSRHKSPEPIKEFS